MNVVRREPFESCRGSVSRVGARSLVGAILLTIASAFAGCAGKAAQDPGPPTQQDPGPPPDAQPEHRHGVGHAILFWLPNRVFDVLDIVRARVRVGPGWTLSARATELLDVNMGAHATVFAGLRGPRGRPQIPWPFGIEKFAGVEVSIADGTQEEAEHAPHYGLAEVGVGFQVLIIGVDIGVDVFEAGDFLLGILFFDPMNDDF